MNTIKNTCKKEIVIPFICLIIGIALPVVYDRVATASGMESYEGTKYLIQEIPSQILTIAVLFFFAYKFFNLKSVGICQPQYRKFFWLIPELGLIIYLVYLLIDQKAPIYSISYLPILAGFLVTAILVGILEELLSRGFVLSMLAGPGGALIATIGSGLVFGLLHIITYNGEPVRTFLLIIETCAAGYYAAVMSLALRSIIPMMTTHFLYDFVLFVTSFAKEINGVTETPVQPLNHFYVYFPALSYVLVGVIVFYFERKNIAAYIEERKLSLQSKTNTKKAWLLIAGAMLVPIIFTILLRKFNL